LSGPVIIGIYGNSTSQGMSSYLLSNFLIYL